MHVSMLQSGCLVGRQLQQMKKVERMPGLPLQSGAKKVQVAGLPGGHQVWLGVQV